jgi:hypothetical protein
MPLDVLVAGVLMSSIIMFALTAGADFGGGFWNLVSLGERAEDFDEPRGESTAYSPKCLFELPRTRLLLAIYTQRRTCAL